jgi:hypothetical protein
MHVQYTQQYRRLSLYLPEDGTVVPKHVGVLRHYTLVYNVCAFSWFSKKSKLIKMQGVSNFKIGSALSKGGLWY